MFRPPLAAGTAHLLPSERIALRDATPVEAAPSPSTPVSRNGSRNDLFSFDWSPILPNVTSRAATPTEQQSKSTRTPPRISIDIPTPSLAILDLPLPPPSPTNLQPSPYHALPLSPTSKTHSLLNTSTSHSIVPPPPLNSPTRSSPSTPAPVYSPMSIDQPAYTPSESEPTSMDPILDSRKGPRLRLSPTREYFLGEGRHATVFLASFIPPQPSSTTSQEEWELCAAKRIFPDRASQISGLGEAFILSRLAQAQMATVGTFGQRAAGSILKLYGVKDERDGIESPDAIRHRRSSQDGRNEIGLGRPGGAGGTTHFLHHNPLQTRSISEVTQHDSSRVVPLRRQASFNSRIQFSNLVPPIGSPTLDNSGEFTTLGDVGTEGGRREMVRREARKGPRYSEPAAPRKDYKDASEEKVETPMVQDYDWEKGVSVRRGSSVKLRPVAPILDTINPPNSTADPPRIILILEYCRFGDLLGFLKQYPERLGRKRWLEWAKQITLAVGCCHERSILHADIKPQNILIAQDLTLRLTDFGMSMFIPPPGSSTPPPTDPLGLGTPAYCPPEFVRPPPSAFGFPSDIFSAGVTLSVMISGVEPYGGMRAVERMHMVGKGEYYKWEERRRMGLIGTGEFDGRASLSRNSSTRSARSSLNGSTMGLSNGGRLRSDSIESTRQSGDWSRGSYNTASIASKLLAPDSIDSRQDQDTPLPSPTTVLAFIPPSSPTLDEFEAAQAAFEAGQDGEPLYSPTTRVTTYSDGTPHQYFLSGFELVDIEIRQLIRRMTNPDAASRPNAEEVYRILESLEV